MVQNFKFIGLLVIILGLLSFNKPFPKINYKNIQGDLLSNDFFRGKKTIAIIGYLGCPAMMSLLKDLQDTSLGNEVQILIFLENTEQQVSNFNSTDTNIWSSLRFYFNMNPLTHNIIAECTSEKIKKEDENIIIGRQCRKLSKKIKTTSSPTIIYVDDKGNIYNIIKGYLIDNNKEERIKKLLQGFS